MFFLIMLFHFNSDEYVYQRMENIQYRHFIGNRRCLGTINENGVFIPNLSTIQTDDELPRMIGGNPPLLYALRPNEPVYEFRSNVLIPMIIDDKRGLIPEVDGKIIDFKDYKYSPTARRIYNLPGRFVPKNQGGKVNP